MSITTYLTSFRVLFQKISKVVMNIVGVDIKWPGFWPITSAVAIGVALWAMLTLSPLGAKDAMTAGGNFVAIVFCCVSNAIGIEVKRGGRHLALNIIGCVVVMAIFKVIATALA